MSFYFFLSSIKDFFTEFIKSLAKFEEIVFHKSERKLRHVYHLLSAYYKPRKLINRNHLIEKLYKNFSIKCAVQYYPLYRYPFYQSVGFGDAFCPNTDLFFDNMLSIPFAHSLTDGQIEFVESSIREVLESL